VLPHLCAQADAGAQALQVFDSWVGALGPDAYEGSVFPYMLRLFEGLADLSIPTIHFGVGTGELLASMRRAGGDVIGVDWRTPLDVAWDRVGPGVAVQGNLDPAVLSAPWDVVEAETDRVLARVGSRDGHIFNLGHGVPPDSDPDTLRRLVDLVHEGTERPGVPS
jgi:uroporphyrinogen decarboxylase